MLTLKHPPYHPPGDDRSLLFQTPNTLVLPQGRFAGRKEAQRPSDIWIDYPDPVADVTWCHAERTGLRNKKE